MHIVVDNHITAQKLRFEIVVTMLDLLPEDLGRQVSLFLVAPDVLNLLSTHPELNKLGLSEHFWRELFARDAEIENLAIAQQKASLHDQVESNNDETAEAAAAKRSFLIHSHAYCLSSVRWRPLRTGSQTPSPREGHLMCVFGPPSRRKVVVTGGFCDDERIHVLDMNASDKTNRRWCPLRPGGEQPSFVYGATITAIDEGRAVRFGGFQAGGYLHETNDVALLTLKLDEQGHVSIVTWETVIPSGRLPSGRAYHSATLILNRFIVVIGGMSSRGSLLDEAILDCETWTWIENSVSFSAEHRPSGRHGHSVLADPVRNRLVLFGGASGSDLLRSGVDNTEIWELRMSSNWKGEFLSSFPWKWRLVHHDQSDEVEDPRTSDVSTHEMNRILEISDTEALCLGRCHVGVRISRDTALLAFGSGKPTTNGLLAYDLGTDLFIRPDVKGPLPIGRFTAAATVIDNNGWVIFHGGYSTQRGGTLGDTVVLDLAPSMNRSFTALHTAEEGDIGITSHPPASMRAVVPQNNYSMGVTINQILQVPRGEHPAWVASELTELLNNGGRIGDRAALILSTMANRAAAFGNDLDTANESDLEVDDMSIN